METVDALLETISHHASKARNQFVFYKPASTEDIACFEKEYKVQLPVSYKRFLLHFNGGFINPDSDCKINLNQRNQSDIGWGYNQFLGLTDIAYEYETLLENTGEFVGEYQPFIPFMLTDDADKLAFKNPLVNAESAIYDCWHEIAPNEWNILCLSFPCLLKNYVEKNGRINTVSSSSEVAIQ